MSDALIDELLQWLLDGHSGEPVDAVPDHLQPVVKPCAYAKYISVNCHHPDHQIEEDPPYYNRAVRAGSEQLHRMQYEMKAPLCVWLLPEGAKHAMAAPSRDEPTLLDRVCSKLTPAQRCTMEYLWEKRTTSFDTLRKVSGAFQPAVADPSIKQQVKRINERMEKAGLPVSISVSDARGITAGRVTLELPDA